MGTLSTLEPQVVWSVFEEICQVPRPSKHEELIAAYLVDFAHKHNLECKQDEVGNVLIKKGATAGYENRPIVVLQSHMDMVCEKNADTEHDFSKDAIKPFIDGEWVKAHGTTLGADDGIGMAAQLAILASQTIEHGAIEALFTIDEETGLTGAFALQPGFFDGKILLNLDSEDEGELFIGCAGGIDTVIDYAYLTQETNNTEFAVRINVKGLQGGHSGDDINKGRGNAIKILNRFIWETNKKYGVKVYRFEGGNLRNAIAREAEATIVFNAKYKENVRVDFNIYMAEMERVWAITESGISMTLESTDLPTHTMDEHSTTQFINALYAVPHGVFAMSYRMPGMVETSTNLAAIRFMDDNIIHITTSQRSDIDSEKHNIAQMIESTFEMIGARVAHGEGYPGWAPNPNSKVLAVAVDCYEQLFGKKPIVRSIHAGLECGLFLEKYPGMDMVSFGPTLRGVHSPDEKIEIASVQKWWDHLLLILREIK
ncbi:MAG: aminoacyl-histidine dipeptidase [Marinifilaceae bacterium]